MQNEIFQSKKILKALEYFSSIDNASSEILRLFTEDATIYFPKLGNAVGKKQIALFLEAFGQEVIKIRHDTRNFNIFAFGDIIVIEGQETGETRSLGRWPDNHISEGRFCNVFEFRDELIKRVSIYADPDFNSDDGPRVEWANRVRRALNESS
jgi:hypothetical protein